MRQTAVEWFAYNLGEHGFSMLELDFKTLDKLIKQALAMEKEQIIDAYVEGVSDEGRKTIHTRSNADQYYEETFQGVDD